MQSQVDFHVGDRLRLRRKILGLTLAELGERCGVSAQQVHKYEQGLTSMNAGRLVQFGDALSVPVSWFFDEGGTRSGLPSELLSILADPQNIKIISLLHQLHDPNTKKLAIGLMQNIVDYASSGSLGSKDPAEELIRTRKTESKSCALKDENHD